ncbi:MAG: serine/threonine-protein kinase, partial [Acidobacteria bacterium]
SSTEVWTRYCGTVAKAGGKQRTQTSSCSSGRLLPTRSEVYRARDTKLDRDVAIKVLPEEFAKDEERLARFEREAKLLASLNHPNIASIYGLEESDGVKALVLELVEGPTLAERIADGPIPLEEALPIARQIADALEAGHEAGVIHRDVKPANVKLKEDGTVKVLDYGLAKALEGDTPSATDAELSQSPTLTRHGTQVGVILGTAAYMSPGQARGKKVDKRADVWAFGAVLYEMLTGRRAFEGNDASEILAAVIKSEPSWERLPQRTPPTLKRFLLRCLAKDPKERVRDIGDVRLALDGAFEPEARDVLPSRSMTPWVVAGSALVIAIAFVFTRGPVSRNHVPARFAVSVNGELPQRIGTLVALSPDGRELVYAAITDEGDQLYHRSMNRLEAKALPGTEDARAPVFSPDGQWVAFNAGERRLKRVSLSGGPPMTICDCPSANFHAWGPDGTIVFVDETRVLMRVSSDGGIPEPITTLAAGELGHTGPTFVPNGEAVLFSVTSSSPID